MNFCAVVVFFAALTTTLVSPEEGGEREDCGPNGFRCKNEKTLEICPLQSEDRREELDVFECDDGFYCDEESPSYCSGRDPSMSVPKDNRITYDEYEDGTQDGYSRSLDAEKIEGPEAVKTTTIGEKFEEDQEFDTNTLEGSSVFNCQSYGFFPDISNKTLFWYCDVSDNGEGFHLRHMTCGQDRHFDEITRNCIQNGTIRRGRQDSTDKSSNPALNCWKRKPGKYPDDANCNIYHLCLPAQFLPAVQLTFECPNGTAYDPPIRSCTTGALSRCQATGPPPHENKIDCRPPTRFRSVTDCSSYFLCFQDNVIEIKCPKFYRFDDTSLECLPEKVADCKQHAQ